MVNKHFVRLVAAAKRYDRALVLVGVAARRGRGQTPALDECDAAELALQAIVVDIDVVGTLTYLFDDEPAATPEEV